MSYVIESIERDEAGIEFYVTQYKPFRLLALRTNPTSFGSTYSREVEFTEDIWRDRVLRPSAKTFVAVRPDTREILSSVTVVQSQPKVAASGTFSSQAAPEPLHWWLNGVFTLPSARRQGIAQALSAAALQYAIDTSAAKGHSSLVKVQAMKHNASAIGMYQRAGFVLLGDDEEEEGAVLLSLYTPLDK